MIESKGIEMCDKQKIYGSFDLKVKQYDNHVNLLVSHIKVASDTVGHPSESSHCHKMATHNKAKRCVQSQNCSEEMSRPERTSYTYVQNLATMYVLQCWTEDEFPL
jgi:hypothetical protein